MVFATLFVFSCRGRENGDDIGEAEVVEIEEISAPASVIEKIESFKPEVFQSLDVEIVAVEEIEIGDEINENDLMVLRT